MKVVEIRNMYISSTPHSRTSYYAKWATMYVIKQIVRLITMKELKNSQSEVEMYTVDSIRKSVYPNQNNQKGQRGKGGAK